jgi:hypothetical protein
MRKNTQRTSVQYTSNICQNCGTAVSWESVHGTVEILFQLQNLGGTCRLFQLPPRMKVKYPSSNYKYRFYTAVSMSQWPQYVPDPPVCPKTPHHIEKMLILKTPQINPNFSYVIPNVKEPQIPVCKVIRTVQPPVIGFVPKHDQFLFHFEPISGQK